MSLSPFEDDPYYRSSELPVVDYYNGIPIVRSFAEIMEPPQPTKIEKLSSVVRRNKLATAAIAGVVALGVVNIVGFREDSPVGERQTMTAQGEDNTTEKPGQIILPMPGSEGSKNPDTQPSTDPTKAPNHSTHSGEPIVPTDGFQPAPNGTINVATFNIRHSSDPKPRWMNRLRNSAQVIWRNKLDIVMTQENRPDQQPKLLVMLRKMGGDYKKFPETNKQAPGFSPNAIYYNSKRFILDKAHSKLVKIKYDNGKLTKKMVLAKLIERKKGPDGVRGEIVAISSHDPANVRPGSERVNAHSREYNAEHVYIPLFEKYTKKGIPVVAGMDANSPYDAAPNCTMTQASTLKDSYEIYLEEKMQGVNHTCQDGRPSRYGKEIDRVYVSNDLEVTNIWTAAAGRYNNGSDIHDTYMVTVDPSNWGQ